MNKHNCFRLPISASNFIIFIFIFCLISKIDISLFAAQPIENTIKNTIPFNMENNSKKEEKNAHAKEIINNSKDNKILPPMALKHLFSPEPDSNNSNDAVKNPDSTISSEQQSIDALLQKIKREIELTGIIITPTSKKAMVLYRGRGAKKQIPEFYNLGNSIGDYTLKDIFPNYVVISQNNTDIKLGLFTERNNRPVPPQEPEIKEIQNNNDGSANASQQNNNQVNGQNIPPNENIKGDGSDNNNLKLNPEVVPSLNPPNTADQSQQNSAQDQNRPADISNENIPQINNEMSPNPFLQAIKRARERQKNQEQ